MNCSLFFICGIDKYGTRWLLSLHGISAYVYDHTAFRPFTKYFDLLFYIYILIENVWGRTKLRG